MRFKDCFWFFDIFCSKCQRSRWYSTVYRKHCVGVGNGASASSEEVIVIWTYMKYDTVWYCPVQYILTTSNKKATETWAVPWGELEDCKAECQELRHFAAEKAGMLKSLMCLWRRRILVQAKSCKNLLFKNCMGGFCHTFVSSQADSSLTEAVSEQRLQRLNEQLTAARKEAEAARVILGKLRSHIRDHLRIVTCHVVPCILTVIPWYPYIYIFHIFSPKLDSTSFGSPWLTCLVLCKADARMLASDAASCRSCSWLIESCMQGSFWYRIFQACTM